LPDAWDTDIPYVDAAWLAGRLATGWLAGWLPDWLAGRVAYWLGSRPIFI